MEKYVFCFIGVAFAYFFCIVCWHRLLNKKIEWKSYKIYLSLFILAIVGTVLNFTIPRFLRLIFAFLILIIINYIFFNRNMSQVILLVLMSELISVISEFIFVIILFLLMNVGVENISTTQVGVLIINLGVTCISFMFLKFKFVYAVFNYLYKTFENMKKSNLIIYFVIAIILISVSLIMSYMNLPYTIMLIVNTILMLFYLIMLFRLANARENYKAINNKYETSLSSLREYEDIMDKYKVANHENKNQLLTIRNMIKPKDQKIANYIDELVDNKIKDNETIFYQTSKIPEGGLRVTIYSKLCKMDALNIEYELDIASDVKVEDLIELDDSTMLNICKIVGVFLDNAIEAVENLSDKYIIIEIFVMDQNLCIEISNSYEGNIDFTKIENKGYTTKGKGHGYGLSLVNDIIKNNNLLIHENEISKELFTQKLKIKM
ncbi:MAG: GHKL domain-containing protein [Bacilli bacterium]|nr:GHKL domain-containing protein [Bacilli bacterium]